MRVLKHINLTIKTTNTHQPIHTHMYLYTQMNPPPPPLPQTPSYPPPPPPHTHTQVHPPSFANSLVTRRVERTVRGGGGGEEEESIATTFWKDWGSLDPDNFLYLCESCLQSLAVSVPCFVHVTGVEIDIASDWSKLLKSIWFISH